MSAPCDEVTEETIKLLVDAFYARVRRDPALAPIFATAIADDAWPVHLEKMFAFWSSVMLTSGRTMAIRLRPPQGRRFQPPMFGDWLDLFEATAADLFVPAIAEQFAGKAGALPRA